MIVASDSIRAYPQAAPPAATPQLLLKALRFDWPQPSSRCSTDRWRSRGLRCIGAAGFAL
jgi:hypothetical protein